MNEQQLTDLVERVGDALDPDVEVLVAGGAARGRVRRRRRAAGSVVAGVATLAVVGALGYTLGPGDDGTGMDGTSVATEPVPSVDDLPTQAPRRFGPDPERMGWVLGDLLAGEVTQGRAWSERPGSPSGFQAGSVLLDGARVTILLEHTEPRPPCSELPAGADCEVVLGGVVSWGTYEEPASGGGPSGILASTATYATSDGFAITATAWNAPDEKHAEPVSADPVLTEQQLVELVKDPVWLEEHQ